MTMMAATIVIEQNMLVGFATAAAAADTSEIDGVVAAAVAVGMLVADDVD